MCNVNVTMGLYYNHSHKGIREQLLLTENLIWDSPADGAVTGFNYLLKHENGQVHEFYRGNYKLLVSHGRKVDLPRWPVRHTEHHQDLVPLARRE